MTEGLQAWYVVPRRDRLAAGEPRHVIDGDLRAGRMSSAFRGYHATGAEPSVIDRWRAALLTQAEEAPISHRSAAVLHAMRWLPRAWASDEIGVDICSHRNDKHRQRDGLRVHKSRVDPCDLVMVHGLLCTGPARTLVDLIRYRYVAFRLGVALIDAALTDRRCSLADLRDVVLRMSRRRGIRTAKLAIEAARCGVDSPPETYLRLDLIDGGIAAGDIDVPLAIRDDDGLVLARGDLGSYDLMLWGEYDGYDEHTKRETFAKDRRGDRWLERRGWHVLRFTSADRGRGDAVAREWRTAARNAPARILAMDGGRSPELARAQQALLAGSRPRHS